jgi:hypothetical protein
VERTIETLCKHLRKRIDANQRTPVDLTVEEIKIRARHGAEQAHSLAWWCDMLRDPNNPVHLALVENDLHCVLKTDCGEVVEVGFFRSLNGESGEHSSE